MAQVFISYAHSTELHGQRIADLASALRGFGLTVVMDTDVTSPAGPENGWPHWMKQQIAESDWTLVYIDETYRRRYDRKEEAGKGRGVTWEGCIISHELYRAATKNDRFIPLLSDGDDVELIPPELSGASRYQVPSQQQQLAEKIVAFESSQAATAASGDPSTVQSSESEYAEWCRQTVADFLRDYHALRAPHRQHSVAELIGLAPNPSDEVLERALRTLLMECLDADAFNVERISLIVAKLDALRDEAADESGDQKTLTSLQDLLLPLCIHPHVKSEVAEKLANGGSAIIDEAVALLIGAELVAASAEGRRAEYRLNDRGEIAGKGLLTFVNTAIGDPNPEYQIGEILKDIAEQLSVSLDEDTAPRDIRKRIIDWSDQLKLAIKVRSVRARCRHYCVVQPPSNADRRTSLIQLLQRVRQEVPELVFFELSRKSKGKTGEEIVMQILRDRFRNESNA